MNALGGDGSSLGYGPANPTGGGATITPSAAIELNLYDAGSPHVPGTNFAIDGGFGSYNPTGNVDFWDTGDEINVVLTYNGSVLTETLTDLANNATYTATYTENLAQILGADTAYVGFSAATGGGASTQTVSDFSFTNATTDTWTGPTTDDQWSNPGNWSTGVVPGLGDTAVIGNGVTVSFDGEVVTVDGVTIQNGGEIDVGVASGAIVTLDDGTTIDGGTLVIGSSGELAIEAGANGPSNPDATLDGVTVQNSGGTIQVDNGASSTVDLVLTDGTTVSGGTLSIGPVGEVEIASGINGSGATLDGVTVTLGVGEDQNVIEQAVIQIDDSSTLTLHNSTISGSAYYPNGGDIPVTGGLITNDGAIDVTGSSTINNYANLVGGAVTVESAQTLTLNNAAVIGSQLTVGSGTDLSGNLTVDNAFSIYVSTNDSVLGTFVTSGTSWPTSEGFAVPLTPGVTNYIHIVAVNGGGPGGVLGSFNLSNTDFSFANGLTSEDTNTADWKVSLSGFGADYSTPVDEGQNGVGPWGQFAQISASSDWLWSYDSTSSSDTLTEYFSTAITPQIGEIGGKLVLAGGTTVVGGSINIHSGNELDVELANSQSPTLDGVTVVNDGVIDVGTTQASEPILLLEDDTTITGGTMNMYGAGEVYVATGNLGSGHGATLDRVSVSNDFITVDPSASGAVLTLDDDTTITGGQLGIQGSGKVDVETGSAGHGATFDGVSVTNYAANNAIDIGDTTLGAILTLDDNTIITGGTLKIGALGEVAIEIGSSNNPSATFDDVNVQNSGTIQVDQQQQVADLVLTDGTIVSGGNLSIGSSGEVEIENGGNGGVTFDGVTVTNNNIVKVDAGDTLSIADTVTLQGGGTVTLEAGSHIAELLADTGSVVTLDNIDNTISGYGTFGSGDGHFALTNELGGTIDATGGTLTLDTGNTVSNAGTLEATSGATLEIVNGTVANTETIELNANGAPTVLQTLVSFNSTDGADPIAGLISDSAGDLFGTTDGGANGYGTVFEIAKTAGGYASAPTTLVAFNDGTDGAYPNGGLISDAAGDLFGTTDSGANGYGSVFEIVKTGGSYASTPTTLVSFNDTDGASPVATLISDAAGDLFGTTLGGASGDGTVFEITKTGGSYASTPTTLASFNGPNNGAGPYAGLFSDAAGDLFGTTSAGGADGDGTVFEIAKTAAATARSRRWRPSTGTDGANPFGTLISDAAGDLFGTTNVGGTNGDGTVFEIVKTGGSYASAPTTLVSFNGTDGDNPYDGLISDAAGDLFGTTYFGGGNGAVGTVFEIAKTSTGYSAPTTLATFDVADGESPYAGLAFDAAGDLVGTTRSGGANGNGTVFELSSIHPTTQLEISGALTLDGGSGGATGPGQVILTDSSGNFIVSNGSAATLTNVDNTISGAGTIGDAHLTLDNAQFGVIDADYSTPLILDTGSNTITNAGMLEATGGGELAVHSTVVNSGGTVEANGGFVDFLLGIGGGSATITNGGKLEYGWSSNVATTFTGSGGTLMLDHQDQSDANYANAHYTGTISGFGLGDAVDLTDLPDFGKLDRRLESESGHAHRRQWRAYREHCSERQLYPGRLRAGA